MGKRLQRSTLPPLASETQRPPDIQLQPIEANGIVLRPPLAERSEWADPDDTDPSGVASQRQRHARKITGYRRVTSIWRLHHQSPRDVTARHVAACQRLTTDYLRGFHGAMGSGIQERVDGQSADGGFIITSAMQAADRYRDAIQALGPSAAGVLCAVVIEDWPVSRVSQQMGCSELVAKGRLVAGLDRLVEHYHPPREVATIRKPGDVLEHALDISVVDIPQNRLGRWKTQSAQKSA